MKTHVTIDGCEAAAYVAFRASEVIAIYPITPSSGMGELSDAWAAEKKTNVWGSIPLVVEMQSEGGAAGAVHGAIQAGSLTTTFTASQGLLLMIPNMFKIAGELSSTVFHISARSVAAHALSIFGDHSDAMACRSTGWGMMFSNSIQEVMDFALLCHAATLKSRVPFLHAFDGFRTSHEVQKIQPLSDDEIRAMLPEELIRQHRERSLNPDRPVMRGTAQNPDVFFQARETCNPFYDRVPGIVQETMDEFAKLTGRQYNLFDYSGAPDAERIIVLMGSGAETAEETVQVLQAKGEKVGILKVRLFRPFSVEHCLKALPATTKAIAVLDRTKEPGGAGEPLYQDIITALSEGMSGGTMPFAQYPKVIGGRYGLSSKEFTPAMVKAVFDELKKAQPKNHFTVGINDDVTFTSLEYDADFITEAPDVTRAIFWGLGADGTVGANKNSIKIIGEETDSYAQGYFVYDSKKSGSVTVSHLRFGPRPIRGSYLIQRANFIACHQFGLLFKYPVLAMAEQGATVLVNSTYGPDEVWDHLPKVVQEEIIAKQLKLFVLDGYSVAKATGMGGRVNTIMQTAFFALSGVLPKDEAIAQIRKSIEKTYGRRGPAVVQQNFAAVDQALAHMFEVKVPASVTSSLPMQAPVADGAPDFVTTVTAEMIAGRGDLLPVSKMPVDGTFPTGTTQWEKRAISMEAPLWEPDICIQCGRCALVCPHGVIRMKIAADTALASAPAEFRSTPAKWRGAETSQYVLAVSVDDCTGCGLCVDICPAKDKTNVSRKSLNMTAIEGLPSNYRQHWSFFLELDDVPALPEVPKYKSVKDIQLLRPLFEFSGACAGCGETPYVKLLSQLFGDRALVANATGCSSIYGGNLPTTPWAKDANGRGPAWANSLFEDNAEFGLGMRLSVDTQRQEAVRLLKGMASEVGNDLVEGLVAPVDREIGFDPQRLLLARLKEVLKRSSTQEAKRLYDICDALIDRSVWIVGGDGWAYDIGYGGLDHVLASGYNINVLVLDTEVYSNTGGQASKATGRGAVAKFAAGGKPRPKKDLGAIAMSYGNIYVAQVAMGANDAQTVKAFLEAEAYDGPSIIIAYSHCIAHGIDMSKGLGQQKLAVDSGYWPLYRFNPELVEQGKNPFQIDSRSPSIQLKDYIYSETRYRMLQQSDPAAAARLLELAEKDVRDRLAAYERLAAGQGA